MSKNFSVEVGPFAKTKRDMEEFTQNLFLAHAMSECTTQMVALEKEYSAALIQGDEAIVEQIKIQLQAYHSSLLLTAHMFESHDEIST